MKRDMKQIISSLTALLLVLGLCACGQKAAVEETQNTPTWQEQYDLGVRYLSEGNYEEAIIAFTAAIEIDPKQAQAYVGRGNAYIGSGETEENLAAAQADYETAIELDETNAQAYLGLADVHIRQGEYDKALEILQLGLEKTDGDQSITDKVTEIESGKLSDSTGRVRRQNYYDPNGDLKSYYVYNYYGDATEERVWYFADGSIDYKEIFYTDNAGNRHETMMDADGAILSQIVFMFDDAGNEIGYENYGPDGELMCHREYTFDSSGDRNGWIDYSADGTIEDRLETTIDEDGNSVTSFYDSFGNLLSYYISILDENGNEIGWTEYAADGTILGTSTYN